MNVLRMDLVLCEVDMKETGVMLDLSVLCCIIDCMCTYERQPVLKPLIYE